MNLISLGGYHVLFLFVNDAVATGKDDCVLLSFEISGTKRPQRIYVLVLMATHSNCSYDSEASRPRLEPESSPVLGASLKGSSSCEP
jgi:hypothetical protein